MFSVINYLTIIFFQKLDRLEYHGKIFFQGVVHDLFDMQIPRFTKYRRSRCVTFQQCLQIRIFRCRNTGFAGGAEGCYTGIIEGCLLGQLEKLHVSGIGTRPAAFDIMNAKVVQPLGNLDLFFGGKADVFPLSSVSQGGVI